MSERHISRRAFLKGGAAAIAGATLLPRGWWSLARAAEPGYFRSGFGITDALCRKVLDRALAKGGDWAEIYFEHTVTNFLWLEDGKVDRAYCNVALGAGIRTVTGDQVGYGYTQELAEGPMLAAAGTAAAIAAGPQGTVAREFVRLKTADRYPLGQLLSEVPFEARLPLVQRINERCFARSPLVAKVSAGMSDEQRRVWIVTSDGVEAEDLRPHVFAVAFVTAVKDGRVETVLTTRGNRQDLSVCTPEYLDGMTDEAVDCAVLLFDAVQPPAGEMPVVLAPGLPAVLLHEAIGHGMEADFNRKEISTYCTMLGRKVAEPFVTIVDDGTIPHDCGALNVDDEGTPGERTVLVQDGILKSYLYDRISARHYGVASTGSGRRQSYEHFPVPRMRTTYMLPGPATPEEIIASVPRGIYVQDVANGEVRIGAGDFAFYVSQGRMIEDGKLTAPIKDVNIMGNGPKMLANMTMVGNDLELSPFGASYCGKDGQQALVGLGMPTVLVKSLTVGGTQG